VLVYVHDGCEVAASVAVVGGGEDGGNVVFVDGLVALNGGRGTLIISWCALQIIFRPLVWLNCSAISSPKV
jgi:hypothetical protein